MMLRMATSNDFTPLYRGGIYRLLHQAIEKLSPGSRSASVEAKRKFIQVIDQVLRLNSSLIGAQKPSLQQRSHTMDNY